VILKLKNMIKIHVTSVPVDNQDKALKFYTAKLGFVKKTEVPMGEHKWLTVVSPNEQNGVELLLEPMGFDPARVYQKALKNAGIPYTSFMVEDLSKEYERLIGLGVKFSMEPREMGPVKIAILDDTCGNNIQLVQML
jgi:catechol 2,3-dioxygenase-like lactoylglutathione lyase family enzyme